MAILSFKTKLAYFPVPKIACNSVKACIFEIENNISVEERKRVEPNFNLHRVFPSASFSRAKQGIPKEFEKFGIVRDPLERFLSGFNEKVLVKNIIVKSRKMTEFCISNRLNYSPNLEEFITQFHKYCELPFFRQHFGSQAYFLGNNLNYFDKLFSIKKLFQLEKLLSEKLDRDILLPRINSQKKLVGMESLTHNLSVKLENILNEDLQLLKDFKFEH